MKMQLKPVDQQIIVITGATSGIGLVTARTAARRGAKLVLNARNAEALEQVVAEITAAGGQAMAVPGDVGNYDAVKHLASEAVRQYGGFDSWVNNAGVSIYGALSDVTLEDHHRLFETNYWGLVHGSLVAIEHLRTRGGALINIGSALSDRAIPLQGAYCASKHAVKGFTDALRMELEQEGAPVSLTLIKPSAIDTPYLQHAKVYLPVEPLNPPPVYAPQIVADAILHCAEHPEREVYVGAASKAISLAGNHLPSVTDWLMEKLLFRLQKSDQPVAPERPDSLHAPIGDGDERGGYPGYVAHSSPYTAAALRPIITAGLAGAALALGLIASRRAR